MQKTDLPMTPKDQTGFNTFGTQGCLIPCQQIPTDTGHSQAEVMRMCPVLPYTPQSVIANKKSLKGGTVCVTILVQQLVTKLSVNILHQDAAFGPEPQETAAVFGTVIPQVT